MKSSVPAPIETIAASPVDLKEGLHLYPAFRRQGVKRSCLWGLISWRRGAVSPLNESGFTIIEILIAVVLIVIGLVAYGVLGGTIVDQNAIQKRSDLALTLAQQKLEELKNSALSATLTSSSNGSDTPILLNNTFTRAWTVTNGAAGSMATLTVTVTWADKSTTRSERLRTYLSQ